MRRTAISILLLIATVLSLASCKKKSHEQRIEYCELGMVLTDEFSAYESDGVFNLAYSDGNMIVGISRYSFVDCEQVGLLTTYSPKKLANVYLERLGMQVDEKVKMQGDVPYFSYTKTESDGVEYYYMPTFYRTQYAYFIITFITPKARMIEGREEVFEYINTVYLLEEYK